MVITLPKGALKALHKKRSSLSQLRDPFVRLLVFACMGYAYVNTQGGVAIAVLLFHTIWASSFYRCIGNVLHECSHFSYFKGRKVNYFFGHILAFIVAIPSFDSYRSCHLKHHSHLGEEGADCDLSPLSGSINDRTMGYTDFLKAVFSPFFIRNYLPQFFSREKKLNYNLCGHALLFFTLLGLGFYDIMCLVYLPFLTLFPVLCFFSDYVDHGGLTAEPDRCFRSRNHVCQLPLVEYLLFPRHDSYHLIHHLYPAMPSHNFAKAHRELKRSSQEYAALDHGLKSAFR